MGCGVDDKNHQQNVDGVVEQKIGDPALFILGIQCLELRHVLFHVGKCIHGWFLLLHIFCGKGHDLFLGGVAGIHLAGQASA